MEELNELQHHGVKGQKWGVRRYQKKDGSLTPLGKKRVGSSSGLKNTIAKWKKKKEVKKPDKPKVKKVGEMTDEELHAAIKRAQLEKQYRDLKPEQVSAGKKFFKTVGNEVVAPVAKQAGKKLLENMLMKAVNKATGDKVDPDSLDALKKKFEELELREKIDKKQNPDKYMSWDEKTKKYDLERKMVKDAKTDKEDEEKKKKDEENK